MKVYDISQEIFGCEVYPGDPHPEKQTISSIKDGALYNLTCVSMCAHNGTHIDSPYHFIDSGNTVEKIPVEQFVGECYVTEHNGEVNSSHIAQIVQNAGRECAKRILFKGNVTITLDAAKELVEQGVFLVGTESQTVGPAEAPMSVHVELLKNNVVILEGVRLGKVNCGKYFLSAAPLLLGGCDGAPCRAVLIES